MPQIVGIKFDFNPKVYYFSPGELTLETGMAVVVDTERGHDYGTVAMPLTEVAEDKIVGKLMPVLRAATEEDTRRHEELLRKREDALPRIAEKIKASGLEMKFVGAEYTFDGGKLVIYFTAENRVDFRELVRELASAFHTRIELKQIGARDECRMKGGIAPCGRACCCSDHMSEYAKVSIKMAKNQNLSLNPTKISGLCGRLMCCLAYENEYYAEIAKSMPKVGALVETKAGETGIVTSTDPLRKRVKVRIENKEKDSVTISDFDMTELTVRPKPQQQPQGKGDKHGAPKDRRDGQKKPAPAPTPAPQEEDVFSEADGDEEA